MPGSVAMPDSSAVFRRVNALLQIGCDESATSLLPAAECPVVSRSQLGRSGLTRTVYVDRPRDALRYEAARS
jgi:hypothetical protein